MKKYKVKHNRDECIGCRACASVCPEFWEMDENDGKSNFKGKLDEFKEYTDEQISCIRNAKDSCPVSCIDIEEEEE